MSNSIDEIILPDDLCRVPLFNSMIASTVDYSLGGNPIIWEHEIKGQPIDLVGTSDTGWITYEKLKALFDRAKIINATYFFIYDGFITEVRFRHDDPPVIEAIPLVMKEAYSDDDEFCDVRIKLMELE